MDDGTTCYVDDDVATVLARLIKILTNHKPVYILLQPTKPISELYSTIKLANSAHLQPFIRGYNFSTHLPRFNEQNLYIIKDTVSGKRDPANTIRN
jgi:hypothetical protein